MTADRHDIVDVATRAIGPCVPIADLSWSHRESLVIELETASGARLIAKAHRQASNFSAEHLAYQRWVPSLGKCAPRLLLADPTSQILIMTKLDGTEFSMDSHADPFAAYRQAGELLARFHAAELPVRLDGYAQSRRQRLAKWVERADPSILDSEDIEFVEQQLAVFDELPDPFGVPCHSDWQPRNWLVDNDGVISAIDFEHARLAPWHNDLSRLWWNEWMETSGLASAFFAGYGRTMDEDEARSFMSTSILGHLTTIVWAHEHGDDAFAAHARRCLALAKQHSGDRAWSPH